MNTILGPGNLTDLKISFKNSWQSEFHLLILVLLYKLHAITTDSRDLPVRWFLLSWVVFDNYYSEFLPSLFLQNFSWRKVDLQCCVIFCCTESTESYNHKIVFYIYNCFCLVLINKFVSFSSFFFLDFMHKKYHKIFVLLCLPSVYDNLGPCVLLQMALISFFVTHE